MEHSEESLQEWIRYTEESRRPVLPVGLRLPINRKTYICKYAEWRGASKEKN